jgi:hypothetical protein
MTFRALVDALLITFFAAYLVTTFTDPPGGTTQTSDVSDEAEGGAD